MKFKPNRIIFDPKVFFSSLLLLTISTIITCFLFTKRGVEKVPLSCLSFVLSFLTMIGYRIFLNFLKQDKNKRKNYGFVFNYWEIISITTILLTFIFLNIPLIISIVLLVVYLIAVSVCTLVFYSGFLQYMREFEDKCRWRTLYQSQSQPKRKLMVRTPINNPNIAPVSPIPVPTAENYDKTLRDEGEKIADAFLAMLKTNEDTEFGSRFKKMMMKPDFQRLDNEEKVKRIAKIFKKEERNFYEDEFDDYEEDEEENDEENDEE